MLNLVLFVNLLVTPVLTAEILHSRFESLMNHAKQPVAPPWDLVQQQAAQRAPVVEDSIVSSVGFATAPPKSHFLRFTKRHTEASAVPKAKTEEVKSEKTPVSVVKRTPQIPKAVTESESTQDPLLCLNQFVGVNPGEKKECPEDKCSDSEGVCQRQRAKRLAYSLRFAPVGLSGSFLRAEVFPENLNTEPALRLIDGWRQEREDATWKVVVSPDNTSVFLSTVASWPEDMENRDGPVRVLDLNSHGVPQMLPLRTAGQAEWRLEDAGDGQIRMRHVRLGRYLQVPTAGGFLQALVQLWSPSLPIRSDYQRNPGTAFQVMPESALNELQNLGLIGQAPLPPIPNIEVTLPVPSRHGRSLKTVALPWGAFEAVAFWWWVVPSAVFIIFNYCFAGKTSSSAATDPQTDRKTRDHYDIETRLQEVIERARRAGLTNGCGESSGRALAHPVPSFMELLGEGTQLNSTRRADLERVLDAEGQLDAELKFLVGRARKIRAEAMKGNKPEDPAPSLPEAEDMLAQMETQTARSDLSACAGREVSACAGRELFDGISSPRGADWPLSTDGRLAINNRWQMVLHNQPARDTAADYQRAYDVVR